MARNMWYSMKVTAIREVKKKKKYIAPGVVHWKGRKLRVGTFERKNSTRKNWVKSTAVAVVIYERSGLIG